MIALSEIPYNYFHLEKKVLNLVKSNRLLKKSILNNPSFVMFSWNFHDQMNK